MRVVDMMRAPWFAVIPCPTCCWQNHTEHHAGESEHGRGVCRRGSVAQGKRGGRRVGGKGGDEEKRRMGEYIFFFSSRRRHTR